MQTVSLGDTLYEMQNPVFWNNQKKNISKCLLVIFSMTVQLAWVIIMSVNIYYCIKSSAARY